MEFENFIKMRVAEEVDQNKIRKYQKLYRQEHKDEIKERMKLYYQELKERRKNAEVMYEKINIPKLGYETETIKKTIILKFINL